MYIPIEHEFGQTPLWLFEVFYFPESLQNLSETELVSFGPKKYVDKLSDGSASCNGKRFTLNYTNIKSIIFDTIKDLVLKKLKA